MKTVDNLSIKRILRLHPNVIIPALKLLSECATLGIMIRITSGLRSFEEQDRLYGQGRSRSGRVVTNAKAGRSFHNYGTAIDFCLLLENGKKVSWSLTDDINEDGRADWRQVVNCAKKLGFESGMDWQYRDNPHLQMTFGLSINELQDRHNAGDVDANGFIKIG